MAKGKISINRLTATATLFAAPGLSVLVILAIADLLTPGWTVAGGVVVVVIALLLAIPVAKDLAQLAAYGDALAHGEAPPPTPALSGWLPAMDLASRFRRIARHGARREQMLLDGMLASQLVFDSLPQPLLLLREDRRVMRVNRAARELIGVDPSGHDLSSAFRSPHVLECVDEVIADKEQRAVNLTMHEPVDRFFSFQVVPLPEQSADGATLLVALFDLTESRRADQLRADFVANASHELRTPLASLVGFIETLRGPAKDDQEAREKFLALMQEQAARMARLVQDLLALSSIELNEHLPPSTAADIARVLRKVAATLQNEAEHKKQMKIVADLSPNLPGVTGDEDQLAQLFQNLIDNAIKYGRAGTDIRVTARFTVVVPPGLARAAKVRPLKGVVTVAVADQGVGIAAEHIPRLTERFYRVDTARSRAIGGTGLGLAIVKHIVNRHRGLIQIESKEGVGSTFTVVLPVSADQDDEKAPNPPAPPPSRLTDKKYL